MVDYLEASAVFTACFTYACNTRAQILKDLQTSQ